MIASSLYHLAATGCLFFAGVTLAFGTPDREVIVREQILGSNQTGFAILRVETDNLGTYYGYRTKRFVDEYDKTRTEEGIANSSVKKLRSTLILDVGTTLDVDDPADGEKTITVHHKDDELSLAEIIEKYPDTPRAWEKSDKDRLSALSTAGVSIGRHSIIWGGWIKQALRVDRNAQIEWALDEVRADSSCIYFHVSLEKESGRSRAWVGIPTAQTEQARAHLQLKLIYLIAGTYGTEKAAIGAAEALVEKCKAASYRGFQPEIWSRVTTRHKTEYVIADPASDERIGSESVEKLEKLLELDLKIVKSGSFRERKWKSSDW